MTIDQAFNASSVYYDDWMKKALPNYADIFGSAQRLIPFAPETPIDVLDLGAGTGLFTQHVAGKYPRARFVLYDVADKMLDVARQRFSAYPQQFEYTVGDFRALQVERTFDLVISSMAIHHLEDGEKQALFRAVYGVVRKPGLFINIDQIRGDTPYLSELYWNDWLSGVRQRGAAEERIQEGINRRLAYDKEATLAEQLSWLAQAGFVNVDCVYKNFFAGVFLAMKE